MRRMLITIAGGVLIGAFAASHAKLPAPPAKSEEQKAAEAKKAAAVKARAAEDLGKAQDRAVANYRKNRASMAGKK